MCACVGCVRVCVCMCEFMCHEEGVWVGEGVEIKAN